MVYNFITKKSGNKSTDMVNSTLNQPAEKVVQDLQLLSEDDAAKIKQFLKAEFPIAEALLRAYDGKGKIQIKTITPVFRVIRESLDGRLSRRSGIFCAMFLSVPQRQNVEHAIAKNDPETVRKWTPEDLVALLGYKSADSFYRAKVAYVKHNFPSMVINALADPSFGAFLHEFSEMKAIFTDGKTSDEEIFGAVDHFRDVISEDEFNE